METVPAVWVCETPGDGRKLAREVLLSVVGTAFGVPRAALRVDHEPAGRPFVVGAGTGVRVSLSHCPGAVAVAVTTGTDVGVDVERVRPLPAAPMARRWLCPPEAAWVDAQHPDQRDIAFVWLWTQKEAVGKARGTGLRGGVLQEAVPLPEAWPGTPGALSPRPLPADPGLAVAAGTAGPDLVVALAYGGRGGVPVRIRHLAPPTAGG